MGPESTTGILSERKERPARAPLKGRDWKEDMIADEDAGGGDRGTGRGRRRRKGRLKDQERFLATL